jgi:hypothetical protein
VQGALVALRHDPVAQAFSQRIIEAPRNSVWLVAPPRPLPWLRHLFADTDCAGNKLALFIERRHAGESPRSIASAVGVSPAPGDVAPAVAVAIAVECDPAYPCRRILAKAAGLPLCVLQFFSLNQTSTHCRRHWHNLSPPLT